GCTKDDARTRVGGKTSQAGLRPARRRTRQVRRIHQQRDRPLVGGGGRGPSEVIRWGTALRDFERAVDPYGVNRDRDGRSQTTVRVRFAPKSGQRAHVLRCPLCAKSDLTHRSKKDRYSITSSARARSVGGT